MKQKVKANHHKGSGHYVSVVGEHSVRVEAVPKGAVDFTEERMLA